MAKLKQIKKKNSLDVQHFGGVDELGATTMHGHQHEVSHVEAKSEQTHLEDDKGVGDPVVIRRFTFGVNPEAFKQNPPTNQQLFNSHLRGIEMALWRDGLKPFDESKPRIAFNEMRTRYDIYVAAKPARGHMLMQRPQTLSEITRSESFGNE